MGVLLVGVNGYLNTQLGRHVGMWELPFQRVAPRSISEISFLRLSLGLASCKAITIRIRMSTAASFGVGKTGKQPEHRSAEAGLNELQCISQRNPNEQAAGDVESYSRHSEWKRPAAEWHAYDDLVFIKTENMPMVAYAEKKGGSMCTNWLRGFVSRGVGL